jgi:adenosylcobinamide amidohydrolase
VHVRCVGHTAGFRVHAFFHRNVDSYFIDEFPSYAQVVAEASSEALGDLLSLLEAREVEQS